MKSQDLLQRFKKVAPAVLRRWFRDDSCLNATRATIEVFETLGVRVEPVSVFATIMNQPWVRMLARCSGEPTKEAIEECLAQGGWALGVDVNGPNEPGEWNGHLVALVDGHIVDAAFRQFARPAKGITVPDVVSTPAPGLLEGKAVLLSNGSAVAAYRFRGDDRSYLSARGFRRSEHNLACAQEILTEMRRAGGPLPADSILNPTPKETR